MTIIANSVSAVMAFFSASEAVATEHTVTIRQVVTSCCSLKGEAQLALAMNQSVTFEGTRVQPF